MYRPRERSVQVSRHALSLCVSGTVARCREYWVHEASVPERVSRCRENVCVLSCSCTPWWREGCLIISAGERDFSTGQAVRIPCAPPFEKKSFAEFCSRCSVSWQDFMILNKRRFARRKSGFRYPSPCSKTLSAPQSLRLMFLQILSLTKDPLPRISFHCSKSQQQIGKLHSAGRWEEAVFSLFLHLGPLGSSSSIPTPVYPIQCPHPLWWVGSWFPRLPSGKGQGL